MYGEDEFFKKIKPGKYIYFSKGIFSGRGFIVSSNQKEKLISLTDRAVRKVHYIILPSVLISLYDVKMGLLSIFIMFLLSFAHLINQRSKILQGCIKSYDSDWGFWSLMDKKAAIYSSVYICKMIGTFFFTSLLLGSLLFYKYPMFGVFDKVFTVTVFSFALIGFLYAAVLLIRKLVLRK